MAAIESERGDEGGARHLLHSLRRRAPVVAACVVLVPTAAVVFSLFQEKQYSATASVLFRDPALDQKLFGSSFLAPSTDPAREAETNVKLVSLDTVADRTAAALARGLTGAAVSHRIEVAAEGTSDIVSVTATDHDPRFAATLANQFVKEYIAFRRAADRAKIREAQELAQREVDALTPEERTGSRGRALEDRAQELETLAALQTGNAELVQPADPPSSPSSPKPVRNGVIGACLGLLLGVGLALLFERLDRRLKSPREVEEIFQRPVLGAVPESAAIQASQEDHGGLRAGDAEAFRMVAANLRYFDVDHEIRSVVVTSSAPGDGKTTVAWNLAVASAETGLRVLLLEADLRQPRLGVRTGISFERGLSNVLAGHASIDDVVVNVQVGSRTNGDRPNHSLQVVLAGPLPPNPTDLIGSDRMREVMQQVAATYDLVVIDTPPTSVVSDAVPLLKQVSGVIVVARVGQSTRDSVEHLRNQLRNLSAPTLGIVINGVTSASGYYDYGASYSYAPSNGAPSGTDGNSRSVGDRVRELVRGRS